MAFSMLPIFHLTSTSNRHVDNAINRELLSSHLIIVVSIHQPSLSHVLLYLGAPIFVENLHDLEVEEGNSLTLECHSISDKQTSDSPLPSAPHFINKLEDHEVSV